MKIFAPIFILIAFTAVTFLILPENCSVLANNTNPFVNCLQDFPFPRLCCMDFKGVWVARAILAVGVLGALASGYYLRRREIRQSVKISE